MSSAEDILNSALELPKRERARIAHELIASLDGAPEQGAEAAWSQELRERARQAEAGEVELDDWDDVQACARARLAQTRK